MRLFHIHNHSKAIAIRYVGFNTREIMTQCRCGSKRSFRESTPFGEPFSFNGLCLDREEFNILLKIKRKVKPVINLQTYYKAIEK